MDMTPYSTGKNAAHTSCTNGRRSGRFCELQIRQERRIRRPRRLVPLGFFGSRFGPRARLDLLADVTASNGVNE